MDLQKLTVYHYHEDKEEERRITLSPEKITVVAAKVTDDIIDGRSVRSVTVLFVDGSNVGLNINHADLELLESAVGAYCFS